MLSISADVSLVDGLMWKDKFLFNILSNLQHFPRRDGWSLY